MLSLLRQGNKRDLDMITLKMTDNDDGMRIDRLLRKTLPLRPLSDIYRMIRVGSIRVNGKKTVQNYRLHQADEVTIDADSAELTHKNGEKGPVSDILHTEFFRRNFSIIYEDDDLVACNKPSGLVVHPGTGHTARDTLIDLVKGYMSKYDRNLRDEPVLVHRIDRDTSGIILVAKNRRILRYLHTHFRDHLIQKKYIALCKCKPPQQKGLIEAGLVKTVERNTGMKMRVGTQGVTARTEYSVVKTNSRLSMVQVTLDTGRTHQIRVHFAHIGCPLLGDVRYGDKLFDDSVFSSKHAVRRLYLHAHSISFIHPVDNKMITLTAPIPDEFGNMMKGGI
jgi:23S rRNA pseudouridine955/2504/2580 synthase